MTTISVRIFPYYIEDSSIFKYHTHNMKKCILRKTIIEISGKVKCERMQTFKDEWGIYTSFLNFTKVSGLFN